MLVSLSREAQADANEAIDWYLGEAAFLAADEFTNELDKALAMLTSFPSLGGKSAHNTRIALLHNFPYSLICLLQPDTIRVIAITHHSRCPGYWAGRPGCSAFSSSVVHPRVGGEHRDFYDLYLLPRSLFASSGVVPAP